MNWPLSKLRALGGITRGQLTYYRLPTLLAIAGVALAVVLMVLLSGLGYGVATAGTEGLEWLEQDLWITAGPLEVSPTAVGGVENPLLDAHQTAETISARDDVRSTGIMAFQVVYVSPNQSSFRTLVGVGVSGNSSKVNFQGDNGFSSGDVHYANGTYSGPMTQEVIIDERTAALFNVTTGETLYIGGTLTKARSNAFTVVGIRSTFGTFLGTSTVTLHLSELQTVTGKTGTDPASLLTVTVAESANVQEVQTNLRKEYPEYSVRTNEEQLRAVVSRQTAIVSSAVTIVIVASLVGVALVLNVLGLLVYHQRVELAALKAAGLSGKTLFALIGGQGLAIGVLGGSFGLIIAPIAASGLNPAVSDLAGFAELIKLPWWILGSGFAVAFLMGFCGAITAGWRVLRMNPLDHLES